MNAVSCKEESSDPKDCDLKKFVAELIDRVEELMEPGKSDEIPGLSEEDYKSAEDDEDYSDGGMEFMDSDEELNCLFQSDPVKKVKNVEVSNLYQRNYSGKKSSPWAVFEEMQNKIAEGSGQNWFAKVDKVLQDTLNEQENLEQ